MSLCPKTIIYRHRKENLKKCSLRPLESREDLLFYTYPTQRLPLFEGYILLSMSLEAPLLSEKDTFCGLLLIDGTWRYAEKMEAFVHQQQPWELRSLPSCWRTAYPRCQTECPDPELGLASVEALYVAYKLMGRDTAGILDDYYWKEQFLEKNRELL